MTDLPTGTVTFLFTDIEGSTLLWQRQPVAMQAALERHDGLIQSAVDAHGGTVFKKMGDSMCAAFDTAPAALRAALEAQRSLCAEEWDAAPLHVRMALHTGTAERREDDYLGPPLSRVARLLAAGHGGQTLLSQATQELVRDDLPPGAKLRFLGDHRLKDLIRPERIYQVDAHDLPSEFPPLTSLDTRPNNLPAQSTPLIGREREVTEVCLIVRRPEVRLLTLTGPGGTGKTRLGLQVSAELLETFEDGVYFVPLSPVSDAALVATSVAQALGVREAPDQPLSASLRAALREKQLLLVLDNFEQVLPAAPLVADLLAAAPRLKVLITSRSMLRLSGEHEYQVQPLTLPDFRRLPPLERLTQFEAVRLFIDRAEAARADFEITKTNAPIVAEICHRLDGLPLAIELAAARVRLLPPQAMLARLNSRLKLLTGGPRDMPARQRTLRATIDWSYDLLNPEEQELFARLAVFAGRCTLEATDAVCDADGSLGIDMLDGLSSLMDKSLLRTREGHDGEPTFVMLATIQEYAFERLQAGGEADALRRRHAEYYLRLAETAEPQLTGRDQGAWVDRLEAEHDNLRAALGWAVEHAEAGMAQRIAGSLWRLWYTHSHLTEGRRWLRTALALEGDVPPDVRARALGGAGMLAWEQGDYDEARRLHQESLAIRREIGDTEGIAGSLNNLGLVALYTGRYVEARRLHEESLELRRALDDAWGVSASLSNLGLTAMYRGDLRGARLVLEESLAIRRERGYRHNMSESLNNLGMAALYEGSHDEARRLHEESLELRREFGNTQGVAASVHNLGLVALDRGELMEAGTLIRQAMGLYRELGDAQGAVEGVEALACLATAWRQPRRAATLWSAAETLRLALHAPLPPVQARFYEKWRANGLARADGALAEARSRGARMSTEQATAYAMEDRPGDD